MAEAMAEQDLTDTTDTAVDAPADAPVDDIDALLAEFEAGTTQPQQTVSESAAERDLAIAENIRAHTEGLQLDSRRQELHAYEQQLALERDQKDAIAAFETIRGNLPAEMFDDRMLDAWVNSRAASDLAIQQAWQNRLADPRTYERTLSKLAIEFGEKFRRYEPESEVDHAAIAQAVRGAGGKTPPEPPPRFDRMTDAELAQWKAENMK